ncbi:MAG: phosphate ABC transporter permease subunit PstC [Bacillota bacterium]|jgi:phosphate transport system permease protein
MNVAAASGFAVVAFVALVFAFMLLEVWPLARVMNPWGFVAGPKWYPVSEPPTFGILPFIMGSAWISLTALLLSFPVGLGGAIYLAHIARGHVKVVARACLEILAGIPSVVMGFIGLTIVAPFVQQALGLATGLTGLTASLVLAVMVLPTIMSLGQDALESVPEDYWAASLALGASPWQTLVRVALPAAWSGLRSAVLLAAGRLVGETMAVLMVAGGRTVVPSGIAQPMRTMTATLAAEVNNAVVGSDHYRALFGIGVVLFLITMTLSTVAAWGSFKREGGTEHA